MAKVNYTTEHVVEVLHDFSGKFLDEKGSIADNVRKSGVFTDWHISSSSVTFFNSNDVPRKDEAVMGSNLIRYITYDPSSKNYFEEKAKKFFKLIDNMKEYKRPKTTRFGVKTKCFVNSDHSFAVIYNKIVDKFYNKESIAVFGGSAEDLLYVINLNDSDFKLRISFGPVKPKEVIKYMSFKTEKFNHNGLYFDIDCYIEDENKINKPDINTLINSSIALSLRKIDLIVGSLGL